MPKKIKTTVVPVSSMQQDNSSLPQVNVDAFRGQGRLAFVWNGLLYVLDGDNGTLTKLSDTGQARWPKWSPDGQWLAYIRYSDAQMNRGVLFIFKPDGSQSYEVDGLPLLVDTNGITWLPASDVFIVSPEGYVLPEEQNLYQNLYVVRPGETPRKVNDKTGILSPDGKIIAYGETLPSYNEQYPGMRSDALYVVPIEGGEPVQLYVAKDDGMIHMAGWWPDAKGLLFRMAVQHSVSIMADGMELYSMPLAGGEPRLLTNSLIYPEWLSWSPDGSKLLAVKGTGREIWRNKSLVACDVKTGENIDLPQRPDTVSLDPCWSPDGKHIAYVEAVEREDLADAGEVTSWQQARTLWVADADGKNARQVNEAGTGISRPLWSRDGSHIIYLKDNSIWLININGGSPVKIAGPLPDAPNSSGYYGYVSLLDILAFYGKQ
ncbi:MAG: biopolymer transporter Tol [Peptococcaceae bacterium]|nr:biopolymer transporter Tol [Peptococcaceae bacterium]